MSNMGPVNSDHEDFGDVFEVPNELEVEEPQVPATQPVEVVSKSEGKQSLSAHSSDVDEDEDEEEEEEEENDADHSASSSHDSSPAESSDDEENEEESDEEVKINVVAEDDVKKAAEVNADVKTPANTDIGVAQTATESPVAGEIAASEPAKRTPRGKVAPKIADLVALFEAKNAENAAKVDDASLLPQGNVKALTAQFEHESNKDVRKPAKPAAVIGAVVTADADKESAKATARLSK